MPLTDYAIAGSPDLTLDRFTAILRDAGSPATPEATHIYAALKATGVRPAVWLAFGWVESKLGREGVIAKYGTRNMGNVRSLEDPALGTIVQTERGPFASYANWADGAFDWGKRLTGPKYAGRGLTTVRQVLPVYAPSGDADNNPFAYINAVLASIEEWVGETKMGQVPQPPITDHIVTLPPRQDGVGLNVNAWNRVPRGTVLHSMGGTLKGTDGYFDNADCPALTDFGIGQVDAGGGFAQIIQWCDYRGRIEPWASGPVRVPEGDGPRFLATWGGAEKLNEAGISIEHDDTTLANGKTVAAGGAAVTVYQWSSSVWLQAWLHAEVLGQTAATFDWNMWHREFCGAAYKTCPNPRITDHVDEYQAAVKAIMAHYQEGTPYPANGLVINGMRINTPPAGGTTPPAPQPTSGNQIIPFVHTDGRPGVTILFEGQANQTPSANVADLGITVVSVTDGRTLDQSVQANQFKGWVPRT